MPLPLLAIPFAAEMAAVGIGVIMTKLSIATLGNEIEEQTKKPAVALLIGTVAAVGAYYVIKRASK